MRNFRNGVSRIVAELVMAMIALAAVSIYFATVRPALREPLTTGIVIVSTKVSVMPGYDYYNVLFMVTVRNIGSKPVTFYNPASYVLWGSERKEFAEFTIFGGTRYVTVKPGETKLITFSKIVDRNDLVTLFGNDPDLNALGNYITLLYIVSTPTGPGGGEGWFIT